MRHPRIATLVAASTLAAALLFTSSCGDASSDAQAAGASGSRYVAAPSHTLVAGTPVAVVLGSALSSETAHLGDTWQGTVQEPVATGNGAMIAAGTPVDGVVVGVTPAKRGSRAMLDLGLRHIRINDRNESVTGSTEAVIAGSTRARNLGAIAGGAAAGALIGKVVGDGKNAAVGGLLGGGAAAAVVAGSKGYQVVLPAGVLISFTVNQTVAIR